MDIIKLSIDEIKKFYYKYKSDEYIEKMGDRVLNKDDIVLVRVTKEFPSDGFVKASSLYYGLDELKNYTSVFHKYFEDYDADEIRIKYYTARSTVHFTINGLVSNQNMSNFTDSTYFIFDTLDKHIDDSLISLREEDTYFKNEIKLSDKAFICMSNDTFNSLDNSKKKLYIY